MITVAVDEITERIRYAFDFIFLSHGYTYQFVVSDNGDINYRRDSNGGRVASLLYERGVRPQEIDLSQFNNVPCYSFSGITDPVATIFFLITRYEEYYDTELDKHCRFQHENSYQFKFGILEKPIADLLCKEVLNQLGLEIAEDRKKVHIIPTFDIDNVYAYRLKKGLRRVGATAKDLIKLNGKRLKERREVMKGEKDPYDTYDLIKEIGKRYPETIVFWLSGGDSAYDRNVDVLVPEHAHLIQEIKSICRVGLHPSYSSYNQSTIISGEKLRLEKVINDPVLHSRFHFLRFTLPESYRSLKHAGIPSDYSMGYAGHCGFRAGTANPFLWYSLETEEVTQLEVFPFTYMDGTLNEYMKLSVEEAKAKVRSLYDEIALCGGNMIAIWHNETIGDYNHWNGWSDVLKYNLSLNE